MAGPGDGFSLQGPGLLSLGTNVLPLGLVSTCWAASLNQFTAATASCDGAREAASGTGAESGAGLESGAARG
jgi:hypothetical protein